EAAHHVQRHIGLEQGAAHFAHGLGHVALGKGAASTQPVENAAEAVLQSVEHRFSNSSGPGGYLGPDVGHRTEQRKTRPRAHRAVGRGPPASSGPVGCSLCMTLKAEQARNYAFKAAKV